LPQEAQRVRFVDQVSQSFEVDARLDTTAATRNQTKGLQAPRRLTVQLGPQRIFNDGTERLPNVRSPLLRLSEQRRIDRNGRPHASQHTVAAS